VHPAGGSESTEFLALGTLFSVLLWSQLPNRKCLNVVSFLVQATIGGSDLLQTSYETDNRSEDDVYKVVPLTPYDDIECVCINEDWSANLSVTLNANLSIGYARH